MCDVKSQGFHSGRRNIQIFDGGKLKKKTGCENGGQIVRLILNSFYIAKSQTNETKSVGKLCESMLAVRTITVKFRRQCKQMASNTQIKQFKFCL